MKVFFIPLILMASLSHFSHLAMDQSRRNTDERIAEALPSIQALQLVSLNYNNLAADYYWLRSISHFGTAKMHELSYPNLGAFLERVVHLDPYFESGYFLAGTALTIGEKAQLNKAIELLEFGRDYCPNDFRIPYLLGFIQYFYERDYAEAARSLGQAAQLPGCPRHIGKFATRLAAESAQPEIGLALVTELLETITDENLRKVYLERRSLLQLEVGLKQLQHYIQLYETMNDKKPQRLQDLIGPGLLGQVPSKDPLGGEYLIDGNGNAATTSEAKRLQLSKEFKKNEP